MITDKQVNKICDELNTEEKIKLGAGKDFWHTEAIDKEKIEPVMMCDGPNGLRKQEQGGDHLGINASIKAVCYPTSSATASSFDRNLLYKLGETLGKECRAEDIGMLLGPGVNIKRSPLCGRNFEYFSEDPYLSGELGTAYVQGLQSTGTDACVKHFACNNQEENRMNSNSVVDERTANEIYYPAFRKIVKQGNVHAVMCSYNKINGVFAAENKELLRKKLREEWGFKGMVVTDWGAAKDRVQGIQAGLDLIMPGPVSTGESVLRALKEGTLDQKDLDENTKHVVKFILNHQQHHSENELFDRTEDHKISGEIEKECAVLLKNDKHILPFDKKKTTAFIGAFAECPRYQGTGSSHINTDNITSPLMGAEAEGIKVSFAAGYHTDVLDTDKALLEEAVRTASNAEQVVIFAGLPESMETEGIDRENIDLPQNQNELIKEVSKANPNTAVVLMTGSVCALPWIDDVNAVLNMYLGGEDVGDAAVALLYGDADPSGKLAESWIRRIEDSSSYLNFHGEKTKTEYREGIFVGYRYYDKKKIDVLFPFGHGLSYTDFQYDNLQIENGDENEIHVSCTIKNIGKCSGKEAVQLYVGKPDSDVVRPLRELKGFEKIELAPQEVKTVKFILTRDDLSFFDPDKHAFRVEGGIYEIEVGSSSRDIRLSDKAEVKGDEVDIIFTRESTIGEIMKTAKGQMIIGRLMSAKQTDTNGKNNDTESMGEGSSQMVQKMVAEMPLGSLVNFGRMSDEQLDSLLEMLNSK